MDMAGIQASKALLRKEIKGKIGQMTLEEKNRQSTIVLNKIINTPQFINSTRVSIYLSTDDEISTGDIVKKIFEANKKCYVPRYNGNVMQMVKLQCMKDWETLPLTKWNIKQPSLKEFREDALTTGGLDLVILPGVGFTKDGWRMGHGKGYYDSFLSKLFKAQEKKPATIGVCFKEQVMDKIPVHDHDIRLDVVLYDNNE